MAELPYISSPETSFDRIDERLRSHATTIVVVGVPIAELGGRRYTWNLNGLAAGRQGLTLGEKLDGAMHLPFEQLMSEGPYMPGAIHERTDIKKREINFSVQVGAEGNGNPQVSGFKYRMIEQRWWASWSEYEDSFLGVYTRTHGWRWLKVRLAEGSKTPFELDPTAYDNNFMEWDMTVVAAQPFYAKRAVLPPPWKNTATTSTPYNVIADMLFADIIPGRHVGEGNIVLPNSGTFRTFPKYLVSAPGRIWIQDGISTRMVELPMLLPDDGVVLVDTDPMARTLTAAKDPVDPLFFQIARNSQFLDFFLHDLLVSGLPVWRRMTDRFTEQGALPARSETIVKVRHSNPDGVISAIVPQRYKMAYG
ncbi:hypothetical protein [Mycobacteroides abscessus]|uniref:hypothetical protein n=1 Tax=Mycobacteroides abscessus TaxID=36809 RepID=UPI00092B6193|nr:hypothetical protein [Mycobacteroides abscessus]SKS05133.1 Bacteriophage protein [Mycobacteroides abscessus subsp. abscessus]SHU53788.1 Bacteriophage protein [Mycobacteroides abscessus subsp. bolletii]SHW62497.1 Bacteriophage protein [Mycobacteroides abscessus subsp. bolletii]SHW90469.1 Bacteriophage protein [Mycobacteroides abscessus subsp. bolletii]SHX35043.1 Bacteriophage protein [Mycobacteroides abscessus subsp. bolletii]